MVGLYGSSTTRSPHLDFSFQVATLSLRFCCVCSAYFYSGETFMKRFLRSKLVLSLAAIIMIAAAVAIPLASSIGHSHAAAPTSAGGLWATGHDADFHCSQQSLQCHYLRIAVD